MRYLLLRIVIVTGVALDPAVPEMEPFVLEIRSQIFTIKIYSDIRGVCVGFNLAIGNLSIILIMITHKK